MTIGDGESSRYIVINPGTRKFESLNPGALFVALSRAKTAGGHKLDGHLLEIYLLDILCP
jgi:hypothetical protein